MERILLTGLHLSHLLPVDDIGLIIMLMFWMVLVRISLNILKYISIPLI